jgi:hypothetical protein
LKIPANQELIAGSNSNGLYLIPFGGEAQEVLSEQQDPG